jgi:hypothetical protein
VLLLLDQLTENVGEARQYFMWLPTAIAWVMVVQFLTLIPVALALRRWLPPTPSVQLATAAAIGALLAIAILQLLLVTGALEFDVRVVLVRATFLMIYTWCSRSARRGIAAAACPAGDTLRTAAWGVISGGRFDRCGGIALSIGLGRATCLRRTSGGPTALVAASSGAAAAIGLGLTAAQLAEGEADVRGDRPHPRCRDPRLRGGAPRLRGRHLPGAF